MTVRREREQNFKERGQNHKQQQKIVGMQEINITRIIGAVEGFLESSLFLEKQHLNTIAESLLLKGLFTVLVLIATAIALRGRRGGYAKRHRTRTGLQRYVYSRTTRQRGFSR